MGESLSKAKAFLRRVWHFIWVEDSAASWIVNVLLAFLIIKYLVYPGLGLVLGTSFPIVAVVSGSMEHPGGFDGWWTSRACCGSSCSTQYVIYDQLGISKEAFRAFPFKNGFNKGDMMVLYRPDNAQVGDVIVFGAQGYSEPIIHRVVQESPTAYRTKGDFNGCSHDFERVIPKDEVLGKAVLRVPYLGWVKLIFVKVLNLFIGWR